MTSTQESVVAIIQARMGSSRFPGKVLEDLAGKPLLAHVLERTRACQTVADTWIATTCLPEDDAIERLASQLGTPCTRGAVDDVLDRYYQAAVDSGAEIIVRITADDPFKDPDVVDMVVTRLQSDRALDYASNTLTPTFPEGLDVEAIRFRALRRAWEEARKPSEREHVTPYIWNHPTHFRLASVSHDEDLSLLRWTVDYPEDLRFARAVYSRLYKGKPFGMRAVLALLQSSPELAELSAAMPRNEAYLRMVAQEKPET